MKKIRSITVNKTWAFTKILFAVAFLLGIEAAAQTPGTFTATGNMITGRYGHTATLLPDGKILIAGGSSLPSAELYDPAAGTFVATGNMTTARWKHFAFLLPGGRVLIIGGGTFGSTSAEIYDSSTGIFTAAGATDRVSPVIAATLLNDGTVLFIGEGLDPQSHRFVYVAELYDPATGTFTATGALATVPYSPMATLLPSGDVLVSDGGFGETCCNGNSPVPCCAAQLYDPIAATFSLTSNELLSSAVGRTATTLMNGKVLLAGGLCDGCGVFSSAAVYDSSTGIFTFTGDMTTGRWAHTANLLSDGTVLIAGGEDFNYQSLSHVEIYDPRAGTFAAVGNMTSLRESHTATLLNDGRVLITGGEYDAGTGSFFCCLASAELYVPSRSPNTPTVQVVDNDTGSKTTLTVGDSFSFLVTGAPPSSLVIVSEPGWSASLGYSDASGSVRFRGTIGSDVVGTWRQTWTIGGVVAQPGPLQFTVIPKQQ